jgi:phosphorylcholine metabolism protein LicD
MGGTAKLVGKHLEAALRLLKTATDILNRAGIRYSLDAGTLLGIIREDRLLPWDTDMDIAVSSEYAPRLQALRKEFHGRGYITRIRYTDKPIGPIPAKSPRLMRVYTRNWFFFKDEQLMDIFVKYKHEGHYYWVLGRDEPLLQFCEARYLDDLSYHTFQEQKYLIPTDFDGYLTHHYGDWRVVQKEWDFRKQDGCNTDASEWDK